MMILKILFIILKIIAGVGIIKFIIAWVVDRKPEAGLFNNHKEKKNYKTAYKYLQKIAKKYKGQVVKPSIITSSYNKHLNTLNKNQSLTEQLYVDMLLVVGNYVLVVNVQNQIKTKYGNHNSYLLSRMISEWIKCSYPSIKTVDFCVFDLYRKKGSIHIKKMIEIEKIIKNKFKVNKTLTEITINELNPDYKWFDTKPLLASKGQYARKELSDIKLSKKRLNYCK